MANRARVAGSGTLLPVTALNVELVKFENEVVPSDVPIPVKWALCELGLIASGIWLPLTWLSPEHHETLKNALRQAG